MRTRTCVASAVIEDDRFLALSLETQALYVHLLMYANVSGKILGVRRIAKSYGLEDSLDELIDNGYILIVDGIPYDRYTWVNNKFSQREFDKMSECAEYQSGHMVFEGVIGKSAYKAAIPERHISDDSASHEQRLIDDSARTIQDNAPTTTTHLHPQANAPSNATATSNSTPPNGTENGKPCMCQKCGSTHASYAITDGVTTITCPDCGAYVMER